MVASTGSALSYEVPNRVHMWFTKCSSTLGIWMGSCRVSSLNEFLGISRGSVNFHCTFVPVEIVNTKYPSSWIKMQCVKPNSSEPYFRKTRKILDLRLKNMYGQTMSHGRQGRC